MDIIRIDDPGDPRIADYVSIRERDLVGRRERFIAEGKVVLNVLFSAARFEAESVLVLESRLAGLSETLSLARACMPVYVASQSVMDAIVGFHIHRGVLAIGRKRPTDDAAALIDTLPRQALVLALIGLANHDNVGSIFRNAAAFGVDAILLDAACCDPLYRKAIRVSVGAALKVPFAVVEDAATIMNILDGKGFTQFALSPSGRDELHRLPRPERTALYLGTEGEGLPEKLLASLKTTKIRMAPGFDSLNVSAAAAVALHHFTTAS